MLRLLLARHGETAWNAERRFQGHADVALSETGRAQASSLAETLRGRSIDTVYASDLCRAVETAEIAVGTLGLKIQLEPAWRELSFGRWEGMTYDEIERDYPLQLQAWLADRRQVAPPGGESLAQLNVRVQTVLQFLKRSHLDQTVLIVAHGGPVQVLLATALGLPCESFWQFRIDPGSLSELDLYDSGAILVRLNQVLSGKEIRMAPGTITRPAGSGA
jgi:alpha-ribazole phosphatase